MTARLVRLCAALLLLAGGVVHYDLWTSGYRYIPTIGPLFMANFIASIILGAAVAISRRATVAFAGMAFAAGSLAALILSRTVGVFGFTEAIWTTEAVQTLFSAVGAIVVLAAAVILQLRSAGQPRSALALQPVAASVSGGVQNAG